MSTKVNMHGQVTIDAEHRKALGIHPGDHIEIHRIGDLLLLTKKDPSIFDHPQEILGEDLLKRLRPDYAARYEELFS